MTYSLSPGGSRPRRCDRQGEGVGRRPGPDHQPQQGLHSGQKVRLYRFMKTLTQILILRLAYRCGMFFPDPKDPQALPVSPLLIFNASW